MAERTPWRRGMVEAVIIVVSILLAFAIDASWNERQTRRLEADALTAVATEVRANLDALEETEETLFRYQDAVDRFLRASPADLSSLAIDSISDWLAALGVPARYDPDESAIDRINALAATSASERGTRVRALLSRLGSEHGDAERRASRMSDASSRLFAHLSRYSVRSADQGRAHWREVYRSELGRARDTLETLMSILVETG